MHMQGSVDRGSCKFAAALELKAPEVHQMTAGVSASSLESMICDTLHP